MNTLKRPQCRNIGLLILAFLANAFLFACEPGPKSPRGFNLPEGDAKAGRQVFLDSKCLACHTVAGLEDEGTQKEFDLTIPIGGEARYTKTYAELVTSVINPSHRVAKKHDRYVNSDGSSIMRNYNDVLTVTQLTDLVSFLKTQYKVTEIPDYRYENIYP